MSGKEIYYVFIDWLGKFPLSLRSRDRADVGVLWRLQLIACKPNQSVVPKSPPESVLRSGIAGPIRHECGYRMVKRFAKSIRRLGTIKAIPNT